MDQLIKQLKDLSFTMQQVHDQEAELILNHWISEKPVEPKQDHFCGYAACVIGYQAISGRLDNFPFAKQALHDDTPLTGVSSYIVEVLHTSGDMFLCRLCRSVWASRGESRKENARTSTFFTQEELDTLPHLNKEYPTPLEAKQYIDLCIEKLEAAKEQSDD